MTTTKFSQYFVLGLAGVWTAWLAGSPPEITPLGVGDIRFGMPLADVENALGHPFEWEEVLGGCGHGTPKGWADGMQLMVYDGVVPRVDVWRGEGRTEDGFGIGTREAELLKFFGENAEIGPHPYVDEGHYVTVPWREDTIFRYIFETEGDTVTSFRAGRLPEVRWIEGCL